jgi:hypothetical protein
MTILFFVSVGVGFFVERRRAGAGVAL